MNITTLKEASKLLIAKDIVDFNTMTVEGKKLLEVCGLSSVNPAQAITRQIERHNLELDKDYTKNIDVFSESNKKPNVYHFTMNAANHVLLAAMTEKGKAARQDAIDMKQSVVVEQTGDTLIDMLSAMLQARKDHNTLAKQVSKQAETIDITTDILLEQGERLERFEQSAVVMPEQPANTECITYIRKRMHEKYGLAPESVQRVLTELSYSPKPAGQVRNLHKNAAKQTFTVWYKADVTKVFKRFVSECDRVTSTQCIHDQIASRFKLVLNTEPQQPAKKVQDEKPVNKDLALQKIKELRSRMRGDA